MRSQRMVNERGVTAVDPSEGRAARARETRERWGPEDGAEPAAAPAAVAEPVCWVLCMIFLRIRRGGVCASALRWMATIQPRTSAHSTSEAWIWMSGSRLSASLSDLTRLPAPPSTRHTVQGQNYTVVIRHAVSDAQPRSSRRESSPSGTSGAVMA